jgi:hypothetical protein
MSTATVITRLQLNWAEVSGITRSFTYEPEEPIDKDDLPAVYPVVLGRMAGTVPGPSAGQYIVPRQYVYRVLVAEGTAASMDSGDLGAYVDELAVAFIDAPTDYFMAHPRLDTASLPILTLPKDVEISDSGLVMRLGPGGATYRAIDYTITIAERRSATRLS